MKTKVVNIYLVALRHSRCK